jgi:hypothetical protein
MGEAHQRAMKRVLAMNREHGNEKNRRKQIFFFDIWSKN